MPIKNHIPHNALLPLLLIPVFLLSGCTDDNKPKVKVVSYEELNNRTQIQKEFLGIKWGASKDEVIRKMKERGFNNYEDLKQMNIVRFDKGIYINHPVNNWMFYFNSNRFYCVSISFFTLYDTVYYDKVIDDILNAFGRPTSHKESPEEFENKYDLNPIVINFSKTVSSGMFMTITNNEIMKLE